MCAGLDSYLKSNNILCTNQFGFRKNSNTLDAIIEFLDYVYSSLDKKPSTIAVFLDFSKAFDTVNHEILMSKLQHNGIRGVILSWFKSYLSNRKQYVSIKNFSSFMSNITLGVPQRSVLGTVLFLLDINDMDRSSDQLRFVHFADDTTVFTSDYDINGVHASVNSKLVGVDNWLKTNRLSLNVSKTSYMIISNLKNALDIKIRETILTKVSTLNSLALRSIPIWLCFHGEDREVLMLLRLSVLTGEHVNYSQIITKRSSHLTQFMITLLY